MSLFDIKNLPEPVFFTSDYDQILSISKKDYENKYLEITGEKIELVETDREMIMLRVWAYRECHFRINANEEVKKNLLFYADNAKLDHLGALYHVKRLLKQKARATIKFEFQQPLPIPLLIGNVGIKTSDNKLIFYLTETKTADMGSTEIELNAICNTAGIIGNDYTPDTINKPITPLPYVANVYNTTTSTGGANKENDDNFRERIYLKPDSISTTGSEDAYIFWTRSAHQDITDVKIDSPVPGIVNIYILLKNKQIPDNNMLQRVKDTLCNEKIKTFTDNINVLSPDIVNFSVDIQIQIYKNYVALQNTILKTAIEKVDTWTKNQSLGKDIVPEEIIKDIQLIEGVYRPIIISPEYQQISNQIAIVNAGIKVVITGAVDE